MWQDNEQGTAIYGETPFMDMTPEEFRSVSFFSFQTVCSFLFNSYKSCFTKFDQKNKITYF